MLDGSDVLVTAAREVDVATSTSFSYEVSDGPLQASGTVQIVIVTGANEAPVVQGKLIEMAAASDTTINVATLASDEDEGDSLTYALVSASTDPLEVNLNGIPDGYQRASQRCW